MTIRAVVPIVLTPVSDDPMSILAAVDTPLPRPDLAAQIINGGETFVMDGERIGIRLGDAYIAEFAGDPIKVEPIMWDVAALLTNWRIVDWQDGAASDGRR